MTSDRQGEAVDAYDLERFVAAQRETYAPALAELRAGRKTGHWMWFVFPQVAGLGRSPTARRYAISGLDEARAYAAHPVLGPRLRRCCTALLEQDVDSAEAIMGPVDATKLRSSMTLFARADPQEDVYVEVLERFFGGREDEATERILA